LCRVSVDYGDGTIDVVAKKEVAEQMASMVKGSEIRGSGVLSGFGAGLHIVLMELF